MSMRWLSLLASLTVLAGLTACRSAVSSDRIQRSAVAASGRGLLLAEGGQAKLPIVIAPQASASTRGVAAELAACLEKISGARFEVQPAAGPGLPERGIVLGSLAEFPEPRLAEALQVRNTYDGKEAYAIRTDPARLLLLGGGELGVSHAAFRFLETLGCRWFFPAPEWEVTPSITTLRVQIDESDRPAILARRIWYGYGLFEHGAKDRAPQEHAAWNRHNRMAQSFTINCGHAWQTIIDQNKAEFEKHPEYLALVKGKRQGEQLCVSNPAVQRLAVAYALDFLRRNPSADMVSMECSDGYGQCECDECRKLGSISDRVFGLANQVAKAVQQEFPGKMVGLYAYAEHCEPPSFALEPNVYVQSTAGFISGRYSFDELIQLWPRQARNMGFYEYLSVWLWDFDRLPGGRGGNTLYLRQQVPRYAAAGATSIDCESGNNWGPHGRGYYLASRLMWNPKADADAILADFYDKAFGPGAAAMKRYYERFDPGSEPLMSDSLLGLGFRDVEQAGRLAGGRPDIQARLDSIKLYLRYIHLRWLLDHEKDKPRRKELTLAVLTHAYRSRYAYMNHWEAIRQDWTPKAATEFGEPTWSATHPGGNPPWAVPTPYTHEEIERGFQEGLAYFQPRQVEEVAFSRELVPSGLTGPAAPAATADQYQGGLSYALYSRTGEPLKAEVICGIITHYRDRAPGAYTLTDAAGKVLAEGKIPLDGQPHPVEVSVPAAGLYFLKVADSSAGWGLRVPAGAAASIVLERGRGFAHMGWMGHPAWFYVPKGTRELQYFWSGGPHKVFGPDGKQVQAVTASDTFVTVPVPEGMDGKAWSFREFAPGRLWFFNAPNYLAASPEALLVPRDLAARDGLGGSK